MEFLKPLWNYLKDWKNLLAHTLVGVGIVLVALVIPVKPVYRIIILIVIVAFNIMRMRHTKKFLKKDEDIQIVSE
ncbi:MAG: hypothetical protein JEZ06_03480 [Anaerolineaceae bacterium]|nr:hypothetical protein [Anaerolineaceae bacterium]